jgi:hypothetical protein
MSGPDLGAWVGELAVALDLDPADVAVADILDLARDAAHGVARPAAPVTAFVVGLAIGRGADPATAFAIASRLARPDGD